MAFKILECKKSVYNIVCINVTHIAQLMIEHERDEVYLTKISINRNKNKFVKISHHNKAGTV